MSVRIGVDGQGYYTVHDPDTGDSFTLHRLCATLCVDDIRDLRGRDVHHRDGVDCNNNPDNLEPLDPGYHRGMNLPWMRA